MIPAAVTFSTIALSTFGSVHPSTTGHPQELLMTWAARSGLALAPAWSVGAMKNWKHSV